MRRTKKKLLVIGIVTVLCMGMVACQPDTNVPETSEPISEEQQEVVESITFPYLIDDGKLEITSLFQYSGMNPDCGNEEGTEIAAIQLKNSSGEYLAEANIAMILADGTELHFLVEELPADKSVMAFSLENTTIAADAECVDASCEATYIDMESSAMEDVITEVDGINIKLTNKSGSNISKLTISCRNSLENEYFGGISYQYIVNDIPVSKTVTVDAVDCILGIAEVVRLEVE